MSEVKHTPGPWQWTQHFDPTISIYKDGFGTLARLYDSAAGTGKANARLIAAAPDLLEALVQFVDEFYGCYADGEPAMIKARAAITKATGKTQ